MTTGTGGGFRTALPGAARVTPQPDGRSFEVVETDPALAGRIGALAAERRWTLTELSRREPSLEDLFLALTKRSGGTLHPHGAAPAAKEVAA